MFRNRKLRWPGLALALTASCASPSTSDPDNQPPGDPGQDPGGGEVQPASDLRATSMGVTIAARDEAGAPRLIRSLVPRASKVAGMTPDQAARDHLRALTPLWMTNQRPAELATHSVQRFRNGSQIVRLAQEVDKVQIHASELRVMVNADGSLAAVSGTMLPGAGRPKFQTTAVNALDRALDALYGTSRPRPEIKLGDEKAGYQSLTVAAEGEVKVSRARAKRELLPEGRKLRAIWTLEVFAEAPGLSGAEPIAHRYLIADDNGSVLRTVNLTQSDAFVYRVFADTTGVRTPFDGAMASFNPHPTGQPDDSIPGFVSDNLVVIEAFNGPRDPWLPNNATNASGNNVDAYADLTAPQGFNAGDIRAEVRAGRTLNYRYDFTASPLANATQSKAAAVNVFYVTNWLHDWYYDSGFTEATGNAQRDNYGRGGVDGDPLLAQAQANALGGSRNNANMTTPADGESPFMNMFLFTNSTPGGVEHDGDFDNAVIAHEWGHYMHLRLASCEATNQCFAMSEGWGDFVALHMMLRETDDREGTFATGMYALASGGLAPSGWTDPGYFGIRRYPYSRSRAKNPLSLKHIGSDNPLPSEIPNNPGPTVFGNPEVHNAGEVWAQQLWEVYNVLLDAHPFAEARRRMSDYVVAGLLLTPPEATYTEARDALITAAAGLDTDDMILMAAAFAGRGSGTCAVAPPRTSFNFTGVVESGTLVAKIGTSTITLTDDGTSCDNDGVLDPGETGTLRVTVANTGVVSADDVVLTATTTTPGVTLGRPLAVGTIAAASQVVVTIPVRLAATAAPNTTLNAAIQVRSSNAGCNTSSISVGFSAVTGFDELAASSRTDNFETGIFAWTPTGEFGDEVWVKTDDATGNNNNVLFGIDAPITTDTQVVSPVLQASPTEPLVVTIQHAFDLESFLIFAFFDGGVIEVTNDGGATWRDVTEVGVDPGYNATISTAFDNPLAGRDAFSGINDTFPNRQPLVLDFGTQFAGQAVQVRFRIGTDFCCTAQGWELDDITVTGTTNTPFPSRVPEPTVCTARKGSSDESRVVEVRNTPRASLDGLPYATDIP